MKDFLAPNRHFQGEAFPNQQWVLPHSCPQETRSQGAQGLHASPAGRQPKEAHSKTPLSNFLCQKWERVLHNQTSANPKFRGNSGKCCGELEQRPHRADEERPCFPPRLSRNSSQLFVRGLGRKLNMELEWTVIRLIKNVTHLFKNILSDLFLAQSSTAPFQWGRGFIFFLFL